MTSLIAGAVKSNYTDPNLRTHFAFLEEQLATSPDNGRYLCGPELTGADILLSFPLGAARESRLLLTQEKYPKLWAYVDRLEAEQGFKKSIQKTIEIDGHYDGYV